MDMSSELANQAFAQQVEQATIGSSSTAPQENDSINRLQSQIGDSSIDPTLDDIPADQHQQSYRKHITPTTSSLAYRPVETLSNNEQLIILREAYSRNPNPGRRELEQLAEKTGRPWNKIREYYRQRRNKMRGLDNLEGMEEPGRATGW